MFKVIYNGEIEAKAHKEVFGDTLAEMAAEDKDVVYLDADLMNSSGTYKFWQENPTRAINCGISEANMMGVAAGLSAMGKKPFAHTFGPFASRRCFDQVFLSIAYAKNNVRIYGSDAGVTAAFNGGTHMPFEDMALMRAIPHATVIDVADGVELNKVLKASKDREGLTYIRSTRKNNYQIYDPSSEFEIGKGNIIRDGKDATIIACGIMVGESMKAAELLADKGIDARVVDMFTVKPVDAELVKKCAEETGAIVTAENHNIVGGLGDAVSAVLLEECPVPLKKVGVQDEFGQVGPQDYLQEVYGLTAEDVAKAVEEIVASKG
ncbi:MAG TPA: transketolase family protein [Clostridiaceae bacterium]|nr:transketolase family protein [Clostridiaceae bacterium]